jgi:hypothetical protein
MLEMVNKYTHAYTSIMKNQTWCKGYVYIDKDYKRAHT